MTVAQVQELYDGMYKTYIKEVEKVGSREEDVEEDDQELTEQPKAEVSDVPANVTLPTSEVSKEHDQLPELLL